MLPIRSYLFLLLILFGGFIRESHSSEPSPVTIDDVMNIRNLVEAQVSPDGNRIVSVLAECEPSRDRFRFSLQSCQLNRPGVPRVLTVGPADFCPRWSPDSQRIAFLSEINGRDQICVITSEGGPAQVLTNVHGLIENFNWSPDGNRIAFLAPGGSLDTSPPAEDVISANQGKPGNEIFLVDFASNSVRQLTNCGGHITGFNWSPDSSRLVFSSQASSRMDDGYRQDLFLVRVDSAETTALVVRKGNDTMPEWSLDGNWIAFQSTPGRMFDKSSICIVGLDGQPAAFPGTPNGVFDADDIDAMDWSADSKSLFISFIDGLESHLDRLDLETGQRQRLTTQPGTYSSFSYSRDRQIMAFFVDHPHHPREVYSSSIDAFKPIRLTRLNQFLEHRQFGEMKSIRWKAPDGLVVEGVLVLPIHFDPTKRCPLVTYLHGGPTNVFRLAFGPYCLSAQQMEFFPVHLLAGKGYAVFCPNPRGSRGRGPAFRQAAANNWGEGPLDDVLSGIDHLIETGVADPERLAIGGWCYGAYLTAWALSHTDRFRVGMAGACISNLTAQFGTSDIPSINVDYFGGTPWEEPERYWEKSPLKHVANIKTPLLLHHGDQDERVPISQGREIYRALKYNGVPTDLLIYKRQGHTFGRPALLRCCIEKNLDWLERWMTPTSKNDGNP